MLDIVDKTEPKLYKVFDMYAQELDKDENITKWNGAYINNVLSKVEKHLVDDYSIDKKISNLKKEFDKVIG